jgi:hypothetical protein
MSNVATLRHEDGKWKAYYGNVMVCQSQDKYRVIRLIRNGESPKAVAYGVTDVVDSDGGVALQSPVMVPVGHATHTNTHPSKPVFDVNERFSFMSDFADWVIDGTIPSLLITGGAGLGKTTTIRQRLKAANLIDATQTGKGDYFIIKGYSTARGLYDALFYNKDKIIMLDDTDKVLKDDTAINILKAALESSDQRMISWNARMRDDDPVPASFEFKGGVIFVSNLEQNEMDDAIRSRCMNVDVSMNMSEKLERMRFIHFGDNVGNDNPPMDYGQIDIETAKRESYDFITEYASLCTELNLRTFNKVMTIRRKNAPHWKRQALYTITA